MEKITFEMGGRFQNQRCLVKILPLDVFFLLLSFLEKTVRNLFLLIYLREKALENSNVPAFILNVSCRLQIPELGGNGKSQEGSQTAPVAKRCLDCHLGPSAEVQHGLVTLQKSQEKKS